MRLRAAKLDLKSVQAQSKHVRAQGVLILKCPQTEFGGIEQKYQTGRTLGNVTGMLEGVDGESFYSWPRAKQFLGQGITVSIFSA